MNRQSWTMLEFADFLNEHMVSLEFIKYLSSIFLDVYEKKVYNSNGQQNEQSSLTSNLTQNTKKKKKDHYI